MKFLNAFSLSMIECPASVDVREESLDRVKELLSDDMESYVGHQSAADLYSSILGIPVAMRRESVRLASGETAVVGQYAGPRLPEGAVELPEGATIKWLVVRVCRDLEERFQIAAQGGGW
jgi:hypothetical protein